MPRGPGSRRAQAAVRRWVPARLRQRLPLPAALLGCGALLPVSMILGVAAGSVPLSPATVLRVIADHLEGHARYSVADAILWDIRFPRSCSPPSSARR